MVKILDKNGFEKLISEKDKLIVVDFFADWCMPCKMLSPVFEQISQEYTDIEFGKINIDLNEALVSKYEIESVPTLLFIKNGIVINQEIGFRNENEFKELIEKFNN